MSSSTRATVALTKLGVAYTLHHYDYDPNADSIGLQAATALAIEPRRMLKTLMAEGDGKPACVVVPSDREVSMKKLASAFGGKTAKMMRPADTSAESVRSVRRSGSKPRSRKRHLGRPRSISMAGSAACRSRSIRVTPPKRSMPLSGR